MKKAVSIALERKFKLKVIVIGLGVQGNKRKRHAANDFVASVDPTITEADYKDISEVPLESYDAALVCTPDGVKIDLAKYLITNKKHLLIEKPLWANSIDEINSLELLANQNNVYCYTAYNHRFEPHFVNMRELIKSGKLGKIYSCRMMYGNGTAKLVKDSIWRDKGAGVLLDLGSHLVDTCKYWFDEKISETFELQAASRFENNAPDHVIIINKKSDILIQLEMTLCMWKNHFTCDVLAEKGSAHITSLCKWGPSSFIFRERVFPSGYPKEHSITLTQEDPTWQAEYEFFKSAIQSNAKTDLSSDLYIYNNLNPLIKQATK